MYISLLLKLINIKFCNKIRITGIIIIIFLLGFCFIPTLSTKNVDQNYEQLSMITDGNILFAPMWSTTTYLIDSSGIVIHTWSSDFFPGVAVYWLGNGMILRTIRVGVGPGSGGAGGGIQKLEWDGTIVWDFRYNTNGYLSHHDIAPLPNGNVLLIAWETKTRAETIDAGRNPENVSEQGFMPSHIIEVQPTGPTSGEIVWQWHVWDHLIQDYDPLKANYGVVENHPELVDINYNFSPLDNIDWMHTNSIDYNEKFDQILLSVRNFNEIWIIDHSTTTEEAASHTGGNSGKGGDLLYRWGNPVAYKRGTANDQKFFGQHDATWIKPGYTGEGNILVFNNGLNRPGDFYSTIDEIVPPVNENGEYYLGSGSTYGPEAPTWTYIANPPVSFYASRYSGAQRLENGNTLICNGVAGEIFEVTPGGSTVWQYFNPYPNPLTNELFKVVYIPVEEPPEPGIPDLECSGSFSWSNVKPGTMINGNFQLQNIGDNNSLLNWAINTSSITWGTWSYDPDTGDNLKPENGQININISVISPTQENSYFEGYIRVENKDDPKDFDLIPVTLKTTKNNYIVKTIIYQLLNKLKQKDSLTNKVYNLYQKLSEILLLKYKIFFT